MRKIIFVLLATYASFVSATELTCKVVGISDGDTIKAVCAGDEIKVRLAEIDAPEKKQAYGAASKQALSDICYMRQARIETQGKDRYGRTIGRIYCKQPSGKEVDANAAQVQQGMAWVYDKYVKDRSLYKLQDAARAARVGLWSDKAPMPPWEWRHSK